MLLLCVPVHNQVWHASAVYMHTVENFTVYAWFRRLSNGQGHARCYDILFKLFFVQG